LKIPQISSWEIADSTLAEPASQIAKPGEAYGEESFCGEGYNRDILVSVSFTLYVSFFRGLDSGDL